MSDDTTAPLVVEGLTKRFGSTLALDRLALTVRGGEVHGHPGTPAHPRPADPVGLAGRSRRTAVGAAVGKDYPPPRR